MSELLFGAGTGPLVTLVQTYPWLVIGFLLCAGLMVYAVLHPARVGDGADLDGLGSGGADSDSGCSD